MKRPKMDWKLFNLQGAANIKGRHLEGKHFVSVAFEKHIILSFSEKLSFRLQKKSTLENGDEL